ncbi:hypothetical protein MCOR02_012416 [Pyricularia oryzae]|nr:hypothetical protein MCOR02_012416 [Pyricularia oryzae]
MLLHNPAPSRQYHEFTRHLQSLDNRYRQHQQYKNRQTRTPRAAAPPARAAPRTQPDIPRAAPKPNAELPLNDPMDLSNQRRHNRKEKCYVTVVDPKNISLPNARNRIPAARGCTRPGSNDPGPGRCPRARYKPNSLKTPAAARTPAAPAAEVRKTEPAWDKSPPGRQGCA